MKWAGVWSKGMASRKHAVAGGLLAVFFAWGPGWTECARAAEEAGTRMTITAGGVSMSAVLDDSEATRSWLRTLPRQLPMTRLFDREYYATLPEALAHEGTTQLDFEPGDVAYWPSGQYFGILFAHTRPLSSPIVVLGKVSPHAVNQLEALGDTETMVFAVEASALPSPGADDTAD